MKLLNNFTQSKQCQNVRYNHKRVEQIRHIPYKSDLTERTEEYASRNYYTVNRNSLRSEKIVYICFSEEVPTYYCRESKEEHTNSYKYITCFTIQCRISHLAKLCTG